MVLPNFYMSGVGKRVNESAPQGEQNFVRAEFLNWR
jgi:hypothetical protein